MRIQLRCEHRSRNRIAKAWLIGTPEQIAERLGDYERAGVERIAMQHLLHRDLDAVELLGRELVLGY